MSYWKHICFFFGLTGKIKITKMTSKDDPTSSCSHLVAEASVLAGWKNPYRVDEG